MRTDYKFGLGRDRRELSYYQTSDWCRTIAAIPKEPTVRFGEAGSNAKLKNNEVLHVRCYQKMPRWIAKILASELGVATAYIYQLRKKINGQYKKWPHLGER